MNEKLPRNIFFVTLLVIVTCLVYAHSLGNHFLLIWDDGDYIVNNETIRGFSVRHVKEAFSHIYMGNYAPAHILSYMLDYTLWGLNPSGYIGENITLHVLNGILFYAVVSRLTKSAWVARAACFIFLLHPVQVESVVWISQRKNLLAMLFFLIAFFCYLKYREHTEQRKLFYLVSFAAFVVSLLAKPVAVILPLVLLLSDFCYFERSERKGYLSNKILYVAAAGAIALVTIITQSHELGGGRIPYHGGSPLATFYTMLTVLPGYLKLLFWPTGLCAVYLTLVKTGPDLSVAVSAAVMVCLIAAGVVLYRRKRHLFFWFGLFFIGLLPVSNIVPLVTLMNDRYLYFPMLGASTFLAILLVDAVRKIRPPGKAPLTAAFCIVLAALPLLSWQRSHAWRDDVSLWSDVSIKEPKAASAWYNLGWAYFQSNQPDKALSAFTQTIALDIDNDTAMESGAFRGLGLCYLNKGDLVLARDFLLRALKRMPDDYSNLENIGDVSYRSGDLHGAETYLKRALEIKPDSVKAHLTLGNIYHDQKRYQLARAHLRKVAAIRGMSPELAYLLAGIASVSGDTREALELLGYAVKSGYADQEKTDRDPDLAALRNVPSYKELFQHKLQ